MMEDVTFIVLGATGDLAKRKLIPAIYRLVKSGKIGKFAFVGAARSDVKIEKILNEAKGFIGKVEGKIWKKIVGASYYQKVDFGREEDFHGLKTLVERVEDDLGLKGNRIFYLATLPKHFDPATHNLDRSRICKSKGRVRVVYEKPFGDDLKSAKLINSRINRIFSEKQIYRIDHYLGKELVGNIALMRFTNSILEPLWNKDRVENVQIILKEDIGIGKRGGYYDKYGVIKDMVQNHALQLLALAAMEAPKELSGEEIRNRKAEVLKKIKVKDFLLGQYKGYRGEKGVEVDSRTETFAALKLEVGNKRWRGVPFFIKVGKNLDKKEVGIYLNFKRVECLLNTCPRDSNYFHIRVQPNEGFSMELNSKVSGESFEVAPVKMNYSHKLLHGVNTPEAYEILLKNVLEGDQSFFVRKDEIESAWKVVDKIKKGKVYLYKKGSNGPKEIEKWSVKNKMEWRA